jgi:TonB-linked SusC/RagA family outer membrane protein
MEKRLTMILACLFLSIGMALAQTQVTGTVVNSEDGQPVIGASIKVVGTNTGTVTNMDGGFSLSVPSNNARLEISYIGMVSKTVRAGRNIKVLLDPDNKQLDEVMVVAYGTQKKSAFTGSAAVVKSDEIGKVQVGNPIDALKGKASGIQINTASGQPGTTPTIRIRGINSINAGNAPLIVVDGSPYDGDLNTINPIDVESMTVLKDAASTALYGARGGNGVILITTKGGHTDHSSITVDAKWGSNSRATPNYEMITSPAKYYEMWYQGLYNYGQDKFGYTADQAWAFANNNLTKSNDYGLGYNVYTTPVGQPLIGTNGKLNPNATLGRVVTYNGSQFLLTPDDWSDATYNNSLRQEYTVSTSGSTDKSNFYGSVNYLDNKGITVASDYKRFTGRLKTDYQLKPWLKVGANMNYAHYNRNYLGDDGSAGSSGNAFALISMAPIYPLYIRDAQGNIIYNQSARINEYDYGDGTINGQNRPYLSQANPLSSNQLDTHNVEGNTFNGTGTAELRLPYGFTVTSINTVYLDEYRYTLTTNPFFGQYASSKGIVNKEHDRAWSYNYQQRLNWHQTYGKNDIEIMLGHEYYRNRGYELDAYKTNQFSVFNKELAGAVIMGSANSSTSDYNTESWLGRAQYNYAEKYFGSVSLMREASSHFDPSSRWGTFWSVGGGWLINKEPWFNLKNVDELKLKASYGENGNDNIGAYRYVTYYSIANSNDNVSLVPSSLGNKKISWEKEGKFNVGVDFSLFKSRLTGTVEYYSNKTSDMLSWFPLPPSYGFTGYYANIGNMINDGLEFDLHGDVISTKDLTWSLYANFTTNHNKISYLPDERKTMWCDGVQGYSSGEYFYGEGKAINTFRMKKYAGVDEKTGKALYYKNTYELDAQGAQVKDSNNQPIVTGRETTDDYSKADYYLCGTALPDAYGGFGTALSWKGLDFSVDFMYQLGGQVYDTSYQSLMGIGRGDGMSTDMLNAWTKDNTNTNVPRLQFNDDYTNSTSDRWLTSASYLTLQNVTLGYTLPKALVRSIGIEKVRFYVVGDNLWTWSKRQGLDPRQSITGSNTGSYYSSIRTISGGITVTF